MNYTCILKSGSRKETWTGQIILLSTGNGWYEAEINGRGDLLPHPRRTA